MISYRKGWMGVVGLLVGVLFFVCVVWRIGAAAMLFAVAAIATGTCAYAMCVPLRRCFRLAVRAGFALPALFGGGVALGGWIVPVGALVVITSPPVVDTIRRGLRSRTAPAGAQAYASMDVTTMSTAEICAAWSVSSADLAAATPEAGADLAGVRQSYLDELERRDAHGFRAWLATGPDPGRDPAEYVRVDGP